MAYIGRQNQSGTFIKLDNIESQFNGQLVTFNLTLSGDPFFTSNPYSLLVSLDGVIQEPVASYIIVENQITFAAAPPVGTNFYCVVDNVKKKPSRSRPFVYYYWKYTVNL